MLFVASAIAALGLATDPTPTQPHLAQAWTALSSGDGLPGAVGKESYIFETCPGGPSEDCLRGHIFDYGADNCIKIEVDGGFKYPSGTYYVKCDAVDCCFEGTNDPVRPDLKQWDIAKPGLFKQVKYLGHLDTTELNKKAIKGAEAWNENDQIPFTKFGVNYTYFVTRNGTDVISHRIDYSVPGDESLKAGQILYGDFKVQKDLAAFRKTFMPPDVCLAKDVMGCDGEKVKEWNKKYFKHEAHKRGLL